MKVYKVNIAGPVFFAAGGQTPHGSIEALFPLGSEPVDTARTESRYRKNNARAMRVCLALPILKVMSFSASVIKIPDVKPGMAARVR
jgi:hypothetical protein